MLENIKVLQLATPSLFCDVIADKKLLTSADALTNYDLSLPLSLVCDAIPVGIGVVITHTYPDGKEKLVAYRGRSRSWQGEGHKQLQIHTIKKETQLVYH